MSQTKEIREHLESGKTLTPLQALALFGCMRLAARVHDLRKVMSIAMKFKSSNGKRYAEYSAE